MQQDQEASVSTMVISTPKKCLCAQNTGSVFDGTQLPD
jgi:hypothetical protein